MPSVDNVRVLVVPPGHGRGIRCGPPAPIIPIDPGRESPRQVSSGLVVLILVGLGLGAIWMASGLYPQLESVGRSAAAWIGSAWTSTVPSGTFVLERW
jgi:hypothetical protein